MNQRAAFWATLSLLCVAGFLVDILLGGGLVAMTAVACFLVGMFWLLFYGIFDAHMLREDK